MAGRDPSALKRRNAMVAAVAVGVVAGMVGLSFASVPLYRMFCQVTGFGGTTQRALAAPDQADQRRIKVRFDGGVASSDLPWIFAPVERQVEVRVGEEKLVFFRARNTGREATTGTATFNVTPLKAGRYFDKVACFCFTEQRLGPGETAELPVSFFIDPAIEQDRALDDVTTITLSYTFFRAPADAAGAAKGVAENRAAGRAEGPRTN